LNISVQAANLSDCRIESNRNFFSPELECSSWQSAADRTGDASASRRAGLGVVAAARGDSGGGGGGWLEGR